MKAFNDDPKLHAKIMDLAKRHAKSDRLVRGKYYEDGKGCAVGCMLFDLTGDATLAARHALYPKLLGLPEWLAHLQDYIFENSGSDFKSWPLRLMSAIKLGGDMDAAHHRIHARIQREVVPNPTEFNERIAALHDRAASGDMPSYSEWHAGRCAALAAARSGRSAAESAGRSAAESAGRSAEWSAEWYVAWSAAESAARSARAAWHATWYAAAESAARAALAAALAQLEQIVLDEVAK